MAISFFQFSLRTEISSFTSTFLADSGGFWGLSGAVAIVGLLYPFGGSHPGLWPPPLAPPPRTRGGEPKMSMALLLFSLVLGEDVRRTGRRPDGGLFIQNLALGVLLNRLFGEMMLHEAARAPVQNRRGEAAAEDIDGRRGENFAEEQGNHISDPPDQPDHQASGERHEE